jgi:phosphoglycerate dehydrogenase-like enzyme
MKILVTDANLVPHRDRLEAAVPGNAVVCWRVGGEIGALLDDLPDAHVYVGGRFPAELALVAEKLRLIHVAGAGTDRVAFAALTPDVLVANTFHHERSIAEYVVSAAVLLRRGFLAQDRALRHDVWASSVYDSTIGQSSSLQNATVGFVGFGHIGQRSWELFRAFGSRGCAVTGSGRVDAAAHGLAWAGDSSRCDRLLREADIVVVSAPLTTHTEGMLGAEQLRLLGPAGVLINVGRGPLVQERALYDALSTGEIASAAIDVWYRYPGADGRGAPSDLPFAELSNVLITPHSSGVTVDTFRGRVDDIAANIGRLDRGEPLHNLVSR